MTVVRPDRQYISALTERNMTPSQHITRTVAEHMCLINNSKGTMVMMPEDVGSRIKTRRENSIEAHNRATNMLSPKLEAGDIVNHPDRSINYLSVGVPQNA